MSRSIDPYDLDEDDIAYLKQRPFLVQEFKVQGFPDPTLDDYKERLAEMHGGQDDGDGDDADNLDPWDLGDLPEDQQWDDSMNKAQLHAVIAARDAARPDGIDPIGEVEDKKDPLVAALTNDDEALLAKAAEIAELNE